MGLIVNRTRGEGRANGEKGQLILSTSREDKRKKEEEEEKEWEARSGPVTVRYKDEHKD